MKTTVSIPGIHCASCAAMIKDVSSEFPEITNVAVDIDTKEVNIEHNDSLDYQKWVAEVESIGDTYTVHKLS